jgi:teichuronic acid biosynthesis glycosyltransferase TuaC
MRILAVIPGTGEDADFIFARRQVESLVNLGLDIQVFYLKSRTEPRVVLREYLRLKKTISECAPDLVHAHFGTVTSFVCACATLRPLAITFRGSDLNAERGIGFLRVRIGLLLSQLSALRASAIFCTSEKLRDQLWWRRGKAVVIPSGINLSLFDPMEKKHARKLLGWQEDKKTVLFNAGRNPVVKGQRLAREAVSMAEREIGPIQFVELNGDISPEKIPIYLNASDCLVLASESEGSPNILKEALACNLPVASVDVGDARERLMGVVPSCVVPRNARSLSQAICEIIRVGGRSNGRDMIQDCEQEEIAKKLWTHYRLLDGSRTNGSRNRSEMMEGSEKS